MYGRRQEQGALDRILDGACQGDRAALMLWGDSGIGKTALLEPAQCLTFAARRLRNEPVVMLLTGHDDPVEGPWEKLPAMEVRELGDDDARLLARALAPQAGESVIRRTIR
ncbi:ATP-binding protein, partial [Streptomyces sp. NPDC006332]|uniref:ATP-binding protein n=1 Tax=Streptomyces sp. NPDC006332 TaxID=3155456 RepID=UPI0033B20EA6